MFFSLGNVVEILCKPTIMPWRKAAARASIRNLQIVNQKYEDDIESESIPCYQKKKTQCCSPNSLIIHCQQQHGKPGKHRSHSQPTHYSGPRVEGLLHTPSHHTC